MAMRVSAAGVPDAAPLRALSAGDTFTSVPAVVFDGSHFVAAWADGVIPFDQQRIADGFSTAQVSGASHRHRRQPARRRAGQRVASPWPPPAAMAAARPRWHSPAAKACVSLDRPHHRARPGAGGTEFGADGTLRSGAGYAIHVASIPTDTLVRVTATGAGAAWIDWFDGATLQGVRVHPF